MLSGKRRRSPRIWKQEVGFRSSDSNKHSSSSRSKSFIHPLLARRNTSCIRANVVVLWIFRNPRNWLTESLITLITWMELDTYLAWSNYEATPHNILLLLPPRLLSLSFQSLPPPCQPPTPRPDLPPPLPSLTLQHLHPPPALAESWVSSH